MTQAEIYLTSTMKTHASTADQLEGCMFGYQALVDLLNNNTDPRPVEVNHDKPNTCLLYTSPSPRDS